MSYLPTQPISTTCVFLDPILLGDERLAPLRVDACELDIKAHNYDSNVIVLTVGPVAFHMNKRQLDFIATAVATAAAAELSAGRVSRELDQTKEVN